MTTSSKEIVLASSSPYKKELFERLDIPFTSCSPVFCEENFKKKGMLPGELALFLAEKKAESLIKNFPNALIIGCDQIAVIGDEILSKPGTHKQAISQLLALQGKTHHLLTAISIINGNNQEQFIEKTALKMRSLTRSQIESYLKTDKPYNCAGSYMLEKKGITLFNSINTEDYTSIIGLPLMKISTILINQGIKLFQD